MTKRVERLIEQITLNIKTCFGDRVLNFVLYGSQTRDKDAEDIDLHLLLDLPHEDDLLKLYKAIPETPSKVDLLISYKSELKSDNILRIRAQGRYFLNPLSQGRILIGKTNHYQKLLDHQDHKAVIRDLLIKNKEYQNSLRDFLIEHGLLTKQQRFAKYLLRYINQTLLILGGVTYDEILKLSKPELFKRIKQSGLISSRDVDYLTSLLAGEVTDLDNCILDGTRLLYKLDQVNELCIKENYD